MKVLIGCEQSGRVREAFKAKGHDAWSVDILPSEIPLNHPERIKIENTLNELQLKINQYNN